MARNFKDNNEYVLKGGRYHGSAAKPLDLTANASPGQVPVAAADESFGLKNATNDAHFGRPSKVQLKARGSLPVSDEYSGWWDRQLERSRRVETSLKNQQSNMRAWAIVADNSPPTIEDIEMDLDSQQDYEDSYAGDFGYSYYNDVRDGGYDERGYAQDGFSRGGTHRITGTRFSPTGVSRDGLSLDPDSMEPDGTGLLPAMRSFLSSRGALDEYSNFHELKKFANLSEEFGGRPALLALRRVLRPEAESARDEYESWNTGWDTWYTKESTRQVNMSAQIRDAQLGSALQYVERLLDNPWNDRSSDWFDEYTAWFNR
jgi:hypothetical protein